MILSEETCCFWNICETSYLCEGVVEVRQVNHVPWTSDELYCCSWLSQSFAKTAPFCTVLQSMYHLLVVFWQNFSRFLKFSWKFKIWRPYFSQMFPSYTLFLYKECFFSTQSLFCLTFLVGHPPLYVTFSVRPSVHPSVCRTPYLRNYTSSDHNFWYTYVK